MARFAFFERLGGPAGLPALESHSLGCSSDSSL